MKPSRHPRRTAYCAAWSSTTPQSMPAGSTWSRSRSACCAASASTAASARATASSPKLPPGNSSATPPAPASPGCSQPSALAPKWPALTPTLPKCHNPCAEVLGPGDVGVFQCEACGHTAELPPGALLRGLGLQPTDKVLGLEQRLRCRLYYARDQAMVSIKWKA